MVGDDDNVDEDDEEEKDVEDELEAMESVDNLTLAALSETLIRSAMEDVLISAKSESDESNDERS